MFAAPRDLYRIRKSEGLLPGSALAVATDSRRVAETAWLGRVSASAVTVELAVQRGVETSYGTQRRVNPQRFTLSNDKLCAIICRISASRVTAPGWWTRCTCCRAPA